MKVLKVSRDLYDFFTPLSEDDKFEGVLRSSDQADGWGKWSRIRIRSGEIEVKKGAELDSSSKIWLAKKFKDQVNPHKK